MAGSKRRKRDLHYALADSARREILSEMLQAPEEEVSPRELAYRLSQKLTGLSYHVRVLHECKAIELVRTERIRGSTQHFYRLMVKADWALAALENDWPDDQ